MSPKTVLILILKKVTFIISTITLLLTSLLLTSLLTFITNIIITYIVTNIIITNIIITNIITICYIIIIILLYHYYIAYRKLARIIHPDKCQDAKAEEAFKLLSQANNCLSNADSRRMYDMTGSDTSDGGGGGFPGGFPGGFGGGGVDMNDLFANIFAQAAAAQQGQRRRGFGGGQPFVFTSSGFPGGMHQGGGVDLDELFRGMGVNVPRQRSSQNTQRQQHNDNTRNSNNNTDDNPEENPITNLIRNQYVQRFINVVKDIPPIISMPVAIFLLVQFGSVVMGFLYRKLYVMGIIFTFNPLKKYTLLILLGLFILDALSIL